MQQPRYRYRLYILTVLVLVGCGVLLTELYNIQIEEQDDYRALVPKNYTVEIREPGVRGEITDRNGIRLAINDRNYGVSFNLKEIHTDYLRHIKELNARTEEESDGKAEPVEPKEKISDIVEEWIIPRLASHNLSTKFSATAMQSHYRTHGGLVPFSFRDDLTYDQFAYFAEHNLELPGVYINVTPKRIYPYGSLGSHLLGYLKPWEKGDVPDGFKHYIGDDKGVEGVEATMNTYLTGSEGIREILKNEKGQTLGLSDYQRPGSGSLVELTIDAKAQYLTETVLRRAGRAAAVVLDPRTGEILAMASVPDYDPNDFIPFIGQERYDFYNKNKAAPFLNRAISNFDPGSIFKLAAAIAGCRHGLQNMECDCIGHTAYGRAKIRCWKTWGHGVLGLAEAIQRSCNPYFMKVANTIETQKMVETYEMLGLGHRTGVRLPSESSGIVPGSRPWKMRFREKTMTPALTGMMSIGQGDCQATPLQLASLVGSIANKGRYYQPRIIRRVIHPVHGEQISNTPKLRHDLLRKGLSPSALEIIRQGMKLAVIKGTAKKAAMADVDMGAKTGTAQITDKGVKTHVAWTVAFAPYESPRYVVAVAVKRGGSGGAVAGPLVKSIMTGLFAAEEGYKLPLMAMQPYEGNFDLISAINAPKENLLDAVFSPNGQEGDEETAFVIVHPEPEEPEESPATGTNSGIIPRAIPVQ